VETRRPEGKATLAKGRGLAQASLLIWKQKETKNRTAFVK